MEPPNRSPAQDSGAPNSRMQSATAPAPAPAPARPVPFQNVTITSAFWASRIRIVQRGALPAMQAQMKDTGRWDCLKLQWRPGDPNKPHQFWDSDIAKWLEAACYTLKITPDARLSQLVEEAVDNIRGAQQDDGYINTYFTVVEPELKWKNIAWSHEMYCAGHLLEAALAHETYSGSYRLLGPLLKYIAHINAVFGPEDSKKKGYPGHEELELALVRAFERTGDASLLALARYFIEERGQRRPESESVPVSVPVPVPVSVSVSVSGSGSGSGLETGGHWHYFDLEAKARGVPPRPGPGHGAPYSYHQADRPIREIASVGVEGHAVRAMYWLSGAAGVARLAGDSDSSLTRAVQRLWASATHRKMYVTGGLGAIPEWEGFGADYYLPNETGYLETCAAVALVFFAHQMLQLDPYNMEYGNVLELALYNAALVGMALDGKSFFYDNPLATVDKYLSRSTWFSVACCPANIARLVGSVGQYAYTVGGDNTIYVQLYIASTAVITLNNGDQVKLTQETRGPWYGGATLTLEPLGTKAGEYTICLRKPPGSQDFTVHLMSDGVTESTIRVNCAPSSDFATISGLKSKTTIFVDFTFEARRLIAHPLNIDNRNCTAIARGPFVYCAESVDNPHIPDLRAVRLADSAPFEEVELDEDGLVGMGFPREGALPCAVLLKTRVTLAGHEDAGECELTLIPYFMWANRGKSDLRVWLPRA